MNSKKLIHVILCVLILAMLLPAAVSADKAKKIVILDDGGDPVNYTDTFVIGIGDTIDFSAEVYPSGAESVKWTTSSSKIATVSDGTVTGVAKGTVTIIAKSESGSASATVQVRVLGEQVTDITVTPDGVELRDGKSLQMKALVEPVTAEIRNVTWSVECTDLSQCNGQVPVSISKTGKLTAAHVVRKTEVTVTATATDGSGVTGTATITVYPKAISLRIVDKQELLTIPIYGSEGHFHTPDLTNVTAHIIKDLSTTDKYVELEALIESGDAMDVTKNVTWSSSNRKIAEVDSTGKVTFFKAGTVTITAKTKDGSGLKATVKITARILAEYVTITGPSTSLASGKSMTLKAHVYPTNATVKTVIWSSLDPTHAATIDSKTGKVTANKNITEPITVTFKAQVTGVDWRNQPVAVGYYSVTVYPAVTSIHIQDEDLVNKTGKTIYVDRSAGTYQLGYYTKPANASAEVKWTSSNTKVATVDQTGQVTITGKLGTAKITVTALDGSGKKASVTIHVIRQVTGISLSSDHTLRVAGKKITFTATITPSKATIKKVKWVVSNPKAFTITGNALKVTVVAKNVTEKQCADVKAVAMDGSGVESATVNVCVDPSAKGVIIKDSSDVDITGTTIKLNKGLSFTIGTDLDAQVYPDYAHQDVSWKSGNSKIVKISGGTITGLKVGTTTVTVTAKDGSGKSATIKIKVVKTGGGGSSLSLDPDVLYEMDLEDLVQDPLLDETPDETVAAAAETVAEPDAAASGESAETAAEAGVFSIAGPDTAQPGQSLTLVASGGNEDEADIFWFSSDEEIARIDADGSVTVAEDAAEEAVVVFTALLNDGQGTFAEHSLTVLAEVPAAEEAEAGEAAEETDAPAAEEPAAESAEEAAPAEETVAEEQTETPEESTSAESQEPAAEEGAAEPEETPVADEADASEETAAEETEETTEEPAAEEPAELSAAEPAEEPEETAEIPEEAAETEEQAEVPAVEAILLDVENDTLILTVGETLTVEAWKLSILPVEADWNTLTFEVENEYLALLESDEAAQIREDGLKITALGVGETKLTLKSGDVEKVIRVIVEALPIAEETAPAEEAPEAEESTAAEEPAAVETAAEEEVAAVEPEEAPEPEAAEDAAAEVPAEASAPESAEEPAEESAEAAGSENE